VTRRALVTGASGFAGKHLVSLLLAEGWDVAGIVRSRSTGIDGVQEHTVEIDDLAGVTAVVDAFRPTHVFHLAAVVDTITTPDVMALYRTNTLGTVAVLEAVGAVGGVDRVLVASSAFAYGRPPAGARPVREDDPLLPLTAYGSSKVAAEAIARQWSIATGTDVLITRAFQHTGPGHVGAYALSDWASQLASGATTLRVGALDVARDYLDVRDVVEAYLALMERGAAGTVYNVASGVPVTMRELLDALVVAFGGTAEVVVDPARIRAVDTPVFVADVARLHADTGWSPRFTLEETMTALAESRRTA
jgi:GDP-4-dehydro-6-deoxy-D-mannose reductase